MSALGNPILSMFEIAASRWAPSVKADGSLKLPSSVADPPPDGAGVGVDGVLVTVFDEGAGAAGAAGVAGLCAS